MQRWRCVRLRAGCVRRKKAMHSSARGASARSYTLSSTRLRTQRMRLIRSTRAVALPHHHEKLWTDTCL